MIYCGKRLGFSWLVGALAGALLVLGSGALAGSVKDLNLAPDFQHAPFLHGVASADPLEDSVLIWTRISPSNEEEENADVSWAVWEADDPNQSFDHPLRSSIAKTNASRDYTLTVDVDRLEQGTRYHYQFQDSSGRRSLLGSTKTLSTDASTVKVAFLSCTSLWSGYFNLYRHLAADEDVDLVLHLGDFIYPEIDREQVRRVPEGICEDWSWFSNATKYHTLTPLDANNEDQRYLQDFIQSLDCSSDSLLERYRWTQNLYMLDPDLRAARAQHPFVVAYDNHDQDNSSSGQLPVDGSRQAAHEWVPQRTQIVDAGEGPVVSSLRHFRLGDNLLDIIMLQTYGYAGDISVKEKDGLLGEGQVEWLDEVLHSSGSEDVQWRVFGSGKAFMPFVVNDIGRVAVLPLWVVLLVFLGLLALCAATEVFFFSSSTTDYYELPQKQQTEPLKPTPPIEQAPCQSRNWLSSSLKTMHQSHQQSPLLLRSLTMIALAGACFWIIFSLALTTCLYCAVGSSESLKTLNPALDTWEGQMDSMSRLFDQLEAHGTDKNNFWASGDMHYSYAADVFRFDPASKNTVLKYSDDPDVKHYGVEMLPASGTRGNLDEMLAKIPFLKPGSVLSDIVGKLCNHWISIMNPHFRYFQGQAHGYGKLTVTSTQIEATFFQFPILEKTDNFRIGRTLKVSKGENKWSE